MFGMLLHVVFFHKIEGNLLFLPIILIVLFPNLADTFNSVLHMLLPYMLDDELEYGNFKALYYVV